jgi:putative spermidine/putrescine transport system substrate-binding protein
MTGSLTRRHVLGAAAGMAAFRMTGAAFAANLPALPKSPVTINLVDVAGDLALTQGAFQNYVKAKPQVVSKFNFTKAPAPELPGKLKAQQDAGRVDIDIVLTGLDALAAGIEQKLWVELFPTYADALPKLNDILLASSIKMQALAKGQGVIVSTSAGGPIIEYAPERVKTPPTTAEDLLAWAKANPNRFIYARPANSGPGREFMMGLPYILGDKDPMDPVKGWDKTWAYLKELGDYIEYYPTGTGATMKEFGEGTRDMLASMTGWDINPRIIGVVPKSAAITTLKGFHFVTDAHFICIPKGLQDERLAVLIDIINFVMQKEQQAITYDKGYGYPGPSVKDVPLSMAPQESQDALKEFGRPEYDKLIAETPSEVPLDANQMVAAFRIWDETVGAKKTK